MKETANDPIEINPESLDGDNYVITLLRPDGTTLKVLIPSDDSYERGYLKVSNTFGLNLVTEGHYL